MTDLAAFLTERITEDEQDATRCADAYPPPWDLSDRGWMAKVTADEPAFRVVTQIDQKYAPSAGGWLGDYIQHIARWDPARVLAECQAKRRIIAEHRNDGDGCPTCVEAEFSEDGDGNYRWPKPYPCPTLCALAAPYSDHPDFDPSWLS